MGEQLNNVIELKKMLCVNKAKVFKICQEAKGGCLFFMSIVIFLSRSRSFTLAESRLTLPLFTYQKVT